MRCVLPTQTFSSSVVFIPMATQMRLVESGKKIKAPSTKGLSSR